MKKIISPRCINIVLAVVGLVVILLFIVTGKNQLKYDEFYFVPNIFLLDKEGLTKTFLLHIKGSPGPLYAVYHYLFFNNKAFNIIHLRLANYFLLLILLFFIFLNSRMLGYKDPLILTLNFIVIPFSWVSCGLGLTEIPAMACAMIGFYLFLKGFITCTKFSYKIFLVFAGGVFFSFAILGRSFYLMAVIATLIWLIITLLLKKGIAYKRNQKAWFFSTKKEAVILIVFFLISAIILPIKVFFIWGALTPPLGTAAVGANDALIIPWYGILAFAYCGFIALILSPSWFIVNRNSIYYFFAITFILVVANIFFKVYEFAPLHDTMRKILPANLFLFYGRVLAGILTSLSFYFILSSCTQMWKKKQDMIYLLIGLIAMCIVFSTVKVTTQFSSRYVAQVLPFFILLFAPFEKTNWNKIIRICIGLSIGFLSLYSYYSGKY